LVAACNAQNCIFFKKLAYWLTPIMSNGTVEDKFVQAPQAVRAIIERCAAIQSDKVPNLVRKYDQGGTCDTFATKP